MRVGFFIDWTDPSGGVNVWSARMARALRELGIQTRVFGLDDGAPAEPYARAWRSAWPVDRVEVTGVMTAGVPNNQLREGAALSATAAECIAWADVLVPNYFEFAFRLAAVAALNRRSIRMLGIAHTDEPYYYRLLYAYRGLESHLIGVSTRCCEHLKRLLPDRFVELLPYGVEDVPEARPGREPGPLRIAVVSRLEEYQKRISDVASIARALSAAGLCYQLRIAGTGSGASDLRQACAKLGPQIEFLGPVPSAEVSRIYTWADVLLLTSEMEGMPFVVLEAMSHGCIAVATRVSGTEDVIIDGINGALFDVGDIPAAVARMIELAGSPARLQEWGVRAQALIGQKYNWRNHVLSFGAALGRAARTPPVHMQEACAALRSPAVDVRS